MTTALFFGTTLFIPERTRYNTEVDGGGNMAFRIVHCNINVTDLNRSIAFYEQALGLQVAAEPNKIGRQEDGQVLYSCIINFKISY